MSTSHFIFRKKLGRYSADT